MERSWDLYWGSLSPGLNPGLNPGLSPGLNPGLNPGSSAYLLCDLQLAHVSEPYLLRVFTWGHHHHRHHHHMTDLEGLVGGL